MSVFEQLRSASEEYRLGIWWDSLPIEAKRQIQANYEGDT